MKRTRFARRGGLTRDAEKLIRLALGLSLSASRPEDSYWEARLHAQAELLVQNGNEDALNAALDQLWRSDARAYDALADYIEASAESRVDTRDDGNTVAVLFAAPILAWSRYAIPTGTISQTPLAALKIQLQAHLAAGGARVALSNFLFSPDQLPRGYVETRELTDRLADAARVGRDLAISPDSMPATTNFLSDTRYLIGALTAPTGEALFRWQEDDGSRDHALSQWKTQGGATVATLLTGCAHALLLPNAYHAACREADRESRPYSLRASVDFLSSTLAVEPAGLRAVIAPFYDQRLEEYRIGFTLADSDEVVHGVVWALLGAEDESTETVADIEAILRECGLTDTLVLDHRMPMEYCDDCGAPLYPDPEGQPVHAELPDDAPAAPAHLH